VFERGQATLVLVLLSDGSHPGEEWIPVAESKPPHVPKKGGGTQERDRNKDGRWREKRDDAGKKRSK
jgi:hypothetical protein